MCITEFNSRECSHFKAIQTKAVFTCVLPSFFLFFFLHYCPRIITLALSSSSNSDPGPHSGPSSSLPTTVRLLSSSSFFFIVGILPEYFSIFFPRRLASTCAYPRCWAFSAAHPFLIFPCTPRSLVPTGPCLRLHCAGWVILFLQRFSSRVR